MYIVALLDYVHRTCTRYTSYPIPSSQFWKMGERNVGIFIYHTSWYDSLRGPKVDHIVLWCTKNKREGGRDGSHLRDIIFAQETGGPHVICG